MSATSLLFLGLELLPRLAWLCVHVAACVIAAAALAVLAGTCGVFGRVGR